MLVHWLVLAAALALTAALMDSVTVDGGVLGLLAVALLFGLVNILVGPLLRLVSAPITLATFGLFALVVNGVLLAVTAGITDVLDVGGPIQVILAALVISVASAVLHFILRAAARLEGSRTTENSSGD
jgi:putative membrane protein